MENIIKNIIAKRKERGISQTEMAKKLGIAQVNYSHVETGKTELTVRRLIKIAEIFNVDPNDLMASDSLVMNWGIHLKEENKRLKRENDLLLGYFDLLKQQNQSNENQTCGGASPNA